MWIIFLAVTKIGDAFGTKSTATYWMRRHKIKRAASERRVGANRRSSSRSSRKGGRQLTTAEGRRSRHTATRPAPSPWNSSRAAAEAQSPEERALPPADPNINISVQLINIRKKAMIINTQSECNTPVYRFASVVYPVHRIKLLQLPC